MQQRCTKDQLTELHQSEAGIISMGVVRAYTVTTALRTKYVPIGYHVQNSTSLLVDMRKKTIESEEQVCVSA